jgi:hypothetical protein
VLELLPLGNAFQGRRGALNTPETAASHPLSAPSASARNDVDQRNKSDNDHYGDGDDGDRGRGNDHALCYPVISS